MFLVETWEIKQRENESAKVRKETPVSRFTYEGVALDSRHGKQYELEAMKRILDAIPDKMVQKLESMWCDSKAGVMYFVTVRAGMWAPNLQLTRLNSDYILST